MQTARVYSHLNGQEHILVHEPNLWVEIAAVIEAVDASACKAKMAEDNSRQERVLYSPKQLNRSFARELRARGWKAPRTGPWATADHGPTSKRTWMPSEDPEPEIEAAGAVAIASYNQTDFVKERIAIEVQFGKYSFVAYDMFVKHMAFFIGDKIDVGIEILPMKGLQGEMSSGVPYYERGLYDLLRQGRGVPAVPLVVIGVVP